MKETLPEHFQSFVRDFPQVWQAHQQLSEACAREGPLDRKTRELIKVGISGAANQITALQRHAVMAVQAGASKEEIYQVILLLITTVGFPRASAAMQWAKSALETG
ncbi:MAG: carboxymuconolactone decarboxylase family protein [Planctomycetes bacterium]|nr:carboxymuconolactone decarboxylase family protein [Planctomycetota bacterium]